ncbi:MAG: AAA-like domain-containing protein, partial [Rivularia sp. ALOHA_DT_140]|nr:AAA-like domain-containing protein [Rivularia sp. ALOHA_DT_140]
SIKSNIVIFIDEIDSILSLKFPTDDFFALIRSCYEKRNFNSEYQRLTFALVGVATPGDLIADKRRTPFNIGRAIQLDGFKESEIEPLAKGFTGIVENPLGLIKEVLSWTGGQPFLTQKVCKLLRDGELDSGEKLESIINNKIIDNWEAHDEPEHLKTIRDRMLLGEQIAGRFLGLYQQILLKGYIAADNSLENMRFRLLGLVVKEDRIIKVYNQIYQSVFNLDWVEKELGKLRPYAESFQAWVDSNYQDESRLLRGQALQDALNWANEKNLSNEDARYLSASQELEKKELAEALATQEEEARILAEANEELRRAQHKSEQANQTLRKAQKKSQRMIRFGTGFLAVSMVGGIVASVWAANAQKERDYFQKAAQLEQAGINLSREPFALGQIQGLSEAIRNGRELKSLASHKQSLVDYPAYTPIFNLQNILLNIRERNQLKNHQNSGKVVAFSPDGKTLATSSLRRTINLWDIASGKEISRFQG